ncbi:hypothetical protein M8818_004033 [Zalaria obscura]|uniref:Uncharacterized protein n=1 Tax=Zalaria obscura TaxID=2024903 RepID=A0ACC3SDD0_9PEZI
MVACKDGERRPPQVGSSFGQMAEACFGMPPGGRAHVGDICRCNQLRTKCDGKTPCAHCVEFGLTCEYVRERKKRGKASRKDLAQQQAAAAGAGGSNGEGSPKSANEASSEDQKPPDTAPKREPPSLKRRRSSSQVPPPTLPPARSMSLSSQPQGNATAPMPPLSAMQQTPNHINHEMGAMGAGDRHNSVQVPVGPQGTTAALPTPRLSSTGMVGMGEYGTMDDYHRNILRQSASTNGQHLLHGTGSTLPASLMHGNTMPPYGDSPYGVPSPQSQNGPMNTFRIGESPISAGFLAGSPVGSSPGWPILPSPSAGLYPTMSNALPGQTLRYPVLKPILPRISAIIPVNLACDLLELYFSSSSTAFMQPASPYLLGFMFRKRSFLRQHNPRPCSPALLASILWVAAQTSESPVLTSPPSARGKICHQLLELTVSLLRPLIHTSAEGAPVHGSSVMLNAMDCCSQSWMPSGKLGNTIQEKAMLNPPISGGEDRASSAPDTAFLAISCL